MYQYASVENLYPYTILRAYELKQHETNNQGRLTRVNLNMVPGTAPKPEFIGATETEITIEFIPSEDKTVASYDLCWRVHAQTWEDASEKLAVQKETFLNKPKVRLDAHGLEPGTTYALRLIAKDIDNTPGSPGPELIVDTDGVSCAPKTCCVMM